MGPHPVLYVFDVQDHILRIYIYIHDAILFVWMVFVMLLWNDVGRHVHQRLFGRKLHDAWDCFQCNSVRLWGVLFSPPGLSTSNRLSEGIPLKFNHMSYVFFQRFLSWQDSSKFSNSTPLVRSFLPLRTIILHMFTSLSPTSDVLTRWLPGPSALCHARVQEPGKPDYDNVPSTWARMGVA